MRWISALVAVLLCSQNLALAQTGEADVALTDWLVRVHQATRHRAYTGTFVVSSGNRMASAKIWHVCDGNQQMERVLSLSGTPRATYRHNDRVVTFFPSSKRAIAESRESLGLLSDFSQAADSAVAMFYQLRSQGVERIAGLDADVVYLVPKDRLRYGFKVWTEKKSGLVLQLQTLDLEGGVLEQAAFSEVQLDAPVNMGQLLSQMEQTDGYRVERPERVKTRADSQGWALHQTVPGFKPMGCYQRPVTSVGGGNAPGDGTMQWVFSDGLATVSVFVENYDERRHVREGIHHLGGATHALTHRIKAWWATAVGEVPAATLNAFVQGLERVP